MAKNISFTETDVLLPPDTLGEQIPEAPGLLPESLSESTKKIRIEISGSVFIIQERGSWYQNLHVYSVLKLKRVYRIKQQVLTSCIEYKLNKWPQSLLGNQELREKYRDSTTKAFVINRNEQNYAGYFTHQLRFSAIAKLAKKSKCVRTYFPVLPIWWSLLLPSASHWPNDILWRNYVLWTLPRVQNWPDSGNCQLRAWFFKI